MTIGDFRMLYTQVTMQTRVKDVNGAGAESFTIKISSGKILYVKREQYNRTKMEQTQPGRCKYSGKCFPLIFLRQEGNGASASYEKEFCYTSQHIKCNAYAFNCTLEDLGGFNMAGLLKRAGIQNDMPK